MAKTLLKILAPTILAGAAFLTGCQSSYNKFENGEFNCKQTEFLNNIHNLYGNEVSYNEMKIYVKSKLDKTRAGIVNKCLKKHAEKEGILNNLDDRTLIVAYEAIKKLD